MKRFAFSLESALALRRTQADREAAALQQLQAELAWHAQALTTLARERGEARHSVVEPAMRAVSPDMVDGFLQGTLQQEAARTHQHRQAAARVTAQEERVRHARQQVMLLEKLRERALAAWQVEANREEEALALELHLAAEVRARRQVRA